MFDENMTSLPITVYGNLTQYNQTISKARCRIFYKYENRNGTYITDEFAEELIASLPYTPVKGIFDFENDKDFEDHGKNRNLGRIYGIVPADPAFAWEKHLDDDDVEREYACCDVYLYTALYEEAKLIPQKSQSMELYRKSLVGDWKIINGKKFYVFEHGCFLGLQTLGDKYEPCFEGASFYELCGDLTKLLDKMNEYELKIQKQAEGGKHNMDMVNFKLSDGQKESFLFKLLNPNCNEEGHWECNYTIVEVYDNYAIVFGFADGSYERVYYTKNDETDSVEITSREQCFIIDVNEAEKEALKNLHTVTGTYAKLDEIYNSLNEKVETLKNENSEFSTKIEELNEQISTLNTDKVNVNDQFNELKDTYTTVCTELENAKNNITDLTTLVEELTAYKKTIEDNNKKTIISEYEETLSEEVIASYLENLDKYDTETLDMRLAYEVKKSNPTVFTKNNGEPKTIPTGDPGFNGLSTILAKYKK